MFVWSMVPEVLFHGRLAPSLQAPGEAEHHGAQQPVQQGRSPHDGQGSTYFVPLEVPTTPNSPSSCRSINRLTH